ncbi:unnamed protein product [Tuber aestivum]|uniref:Mid2 domain-containing protein n=1 Tax=Tuber aestivum TaxID=59557 RepID=A0A292PP39_9PEZI|nr:unnamed protein product [Tuber aestivum]
MGFRQRNSALLLALLGLGSVLGVHGSWLFGAMEEREADNRRAMQPRQFVQCSAGSRACGVLGCLASTRCCNAGAGWGCLTGNACYTAASFIDCYSTTMVMPTVSRRCFDFTQTGCSAGQPCFTCAATAPLCATEVIAGGGGTWLACSSTATVLTITATADTLTENTASQSAPADETNTRSVASRSRTSTGAWPTRTGTTMSPYPTETPPDDKLSAGAIAGIAIGSVAGIAIIAALLFFFCVRKDNRGPNGAVPVPQQYPPQQPYQQPPYSPPPQQQQYMSQPQYGQMSAYQGQMAQNTYVPEGQAMVPPIVSPVYTEPPPKHPATMPVELH